MHIRFPQDLGSDKFISVVVLSYKRPDLTLDLINSIHDHADMPFELIVHDDSSPDEDKQVLYDNRDKMSSLILTGGDLNMGLAASFERGVSLASSDYVLCLNNDALMVGPGFQRIVRVLHAPYVGVFGPWQISTNPVGGHNTVLVQHRGIKFYLGSMCGSGSIMAFRKAVWEEVGGWPHVMTGSSDTAFMRKLLHHGYFNAFRADDPNGQETWDNVDFPRCERTVIGPNKHDASYPWLFHKRHADGELNTISTVNTGRCREFVEAFTREEQYKDAGITNNDWWYNHIHGNVLEDKNNFNWDALTYHQRFRGEVERDLL